MTEFVPRILIRDATPEDVPFVARCVLAAAGLYDYRHHSPMAEITEEVCSTDGTIYTYRKARIACVEGIPVGGIVAYDGATYQEARRLTFHMIDSAGGTIPRPDMEIGAGEYYLDSMAVMPSFRGYGIGSLLIRDALERARAAGFCKVSLVIESDREALVSYYAELGFEAAGGINALGHRYTRMEKAVF